VGAPDKCPLYGSGGLKDRCHKTYYDGNGISNKIRVDDAATADKNSPLPDTTLKSKLTIIGKGLSII